MLYGRRIVVRLKGEFGEVELTDEMKDQPNSDYDNSRKNVVDRALEAYLKLKDCSQ